MRFLFETTKRDFSDLAGGRVLYSVVGAAPPPVRLICEVFQRCASLLEDSGVYRPLVVYDPLCGTGYLLTVIGFLHRDRIVELWGSDINADLVAIAEANLSLLSESGILARERWLREQAAQFNKPSHAEAVHSVVRLRRLVESRAEPIVRCHLADALCEIPPVVNVRRVDLVFADLPYGNLADWHEADSLECPPEEAFMQRCASWMRPGAILAAFTSKKQHLEHSAFRRRMRLRHGRRQVWVFERRTP